jgi:hypothetical protein
VPAACRRVASGAALGSVVEALRAWEAERQTVQAKLEHVDGLSRTARAWDREGLVIAVRERLTDWHGLLESEPVQARQFLRKVLAGRIVFTAYPEAPRPYYMFEGRASYGWLLAGIVGAKGLVPPG